MGTGPGLKLVLVSMSPISKCYRGLSPLNRNVAGRGDAGHHQCGINFPSGCNNWVSCHGWKGNGARRTNPVEEIVVY